MSRLCLTIARFCLCLWVGAAALFVVTSIAEQRCPDFSEPIKNELALLRFPWYYRFGFTLLGATLAAGHFARGHRDLAGAARWIVFGFTALSLALMTVDYYAVFQPLAEMITPPDRAIAGEFRQYHEMSKWINLAHVSCALIAAVALCRPARG